MARRRGPLLLSVSLVLAVLAAIAANNWLSRASGKNAPVREQDVTAAVDLPLGTKIEQRHLSMIEVLPGKSPKGAFHSYAEVLGKVTTSGVLAGEIMLAPRLTDAGEGSALASVVNKNMRAVTVRVDDVVGVAGFLLPGNKVDVIAVKMDPGSTVAHATTILSNVKVLAVDQTASADSNQPVVVHAVTLELSPADAETLLKGKTAGGIQLTLRNPLDQSDARSQQPPEPEPVLVKTAAVKVRPAAVSKPAPLEITLIRGTKVGHTAQNADQQQDSGR
jgi:pilus assembly protein CpaB